MGFTITEGVPDHENLPDTLTWRSYVNGLWDDAAKWNPSFAPNALDRVSFKVLPATATQRTVPLPDIIVTSTGNAAREVEQMDVSRSAVNLRNFSLETTRLGTSLRISDGGQLTLDATTPLPASGHFDFSTTDAIIGLGTAQVIAPGKRLALAEMTIGPNVLWQDAGSFIAVAAR